ncbi:MAG: LysR substrate-binding domain-containing protein [Gammaproteobacteria bacterium]
MAYSFSSAIGGAGVTLLPELAVATEAKRARLALRPFTPPVPKRTIARVWRPRSPLDPSLRRLAVTARDAFGDGAASKAARSNPRVGR